MVKTIEGQTKIKGKRFAIVVSRYNDYITKNLLSGCLSELKRCGVKESEMTVVWVPGAFEIPIAALRLAKKKTVAAVICLGAVIRGETFHFELVANGVANGIAQVSLQTLKPVIFEVLATETIQQAQKRSRLKGDNKGREAALTAVEMVSLLKQI